jgi:hypothetical protein
MSQTINLVDPDIATLVVIVNASATAAYVDPDLASLVIIT